MQESPPAAMAIFTFGSDSPVGGITLRRASTGTARAYLSAGDNATPQQIDALLKPMREGRSLLDKERSWQFIPTTLNGKPVLEVRDFGTPLDLWTSLEKHGLLVGKATGAQKEPEDKFSLRERMAKQVLRISGALYLIGDLSFFIYGKLGSRENAKGEKPKSKLEEQLAAIFYMMGSASLVFFARDTSSQQLRDVAGHLRRQMVRHGLQADSDTALGQVADTSIHRPIDKVGNFIRKYHSDIMNVSFAASGVAQIVGANQDRAELHAGLREMKLEGEAVAATLPGLTGEKLADAQRTIGRYDHDTVKSLEKRNLSRVDIAVGTLTGLAGLTTMLTPEKTEEERAQLKTETNPLKRAVNWFREKPMRISGYGLLGSTALHLFSSLQNLSFSNRVISTHNDLAKGNPHLLDAAGVNRLLGDRRADARSQLAQHDEMAANGHVGLLTADELNGYDRKRTSFGFRMVFVVTNIIAELLMTFSDKGHGESVSSKSDVAKSACAMVAEVVARQPEERQTQLIRSMAEILASSKALGGKPEDYMACLTSELETQKNNPWSSQPNAAARDKMRMGATQMETQTPQPTPSLAPETSQSHLARAAAKRAGQDHITGPEDYRAATIAPRQARYAEQHSAEKAQGATDLVRV